MADTVATKQLVRRLGMGEHPEGGRFAERHYEHEGDGRAASGAIYYHLGPDERSDFHQIDCGEYWCHTLGDPLEIWSVSPEGVLDVRRLGIDEGSEPMAYVAPGSIFAARHLPGATEGTLVCCVTVPRFDYEGFRLVGRAELEAVCPEALSFFA